MTGAGTYLLGALGAARRTVAEPWTVFKTRTGGMRAQRITVDGIAPGREVPLQLVDRGAVVASANASTLPATLPLLGERPFTVLHGSCFSVAQDPAGDVGAVVARLPAFARPHVTILCGDQVYLDSPFSHFLACMHSREDLAEE